MQVLTKADLYAEIMDVISSGKEGVEKLESYIKRLELTDADFLLDEKDVAWGPAVSRPRKSMCVGLNYRKHADETKAKYPETPIIFNKFDNAITGYLTVIKVPRTIDSMNH